MPGYWIVDVAAKVVRIQRLNQVKTLLRGDPLQRQNGVWGATEQKTGLSTGCRQPLDRRDVNIERLGAVP
jgi:hypothetical protein